MKIHKLKKLLNEALNNFDEDAVEMWMAEQYIPFTVALKEIFPDYQIAVLNDEHELDDENVEYNFDFVHAFCYDPKHKTKIIDAKGIREIEELKDDFYDINPAIDLDIPDSKFLIDNFAGKEFYSVESFEYDFESYEEAKEWILKYIDVYNINKK